MQHLFRISVTKLIAAIALVAPLTFAHAHGDVSWSVSVGSPAPVYAPPPAVYVQPQPVYVRPQPVYVRPATIVEYSQPYYVEEVRYRKHGHGQGHWKHHHHD
ncbi:hypothetical protein [Noviherbaspirillum sp. UKPF54]|uniref:hypothetical protein n=1 Tax=Noviherbaspirillum sp. UKPF54 TaxID=2601898 RepID=UPI001FEFEF9C|nr:hypothetical protein [Noviherbaspirillum sp. UKPF54]